MSASGAAGAYRAVKVGSRARPADGAMVEKGASWLTYLLHLDVLDRALDHSTCRDGSVGIRLARRLPCATR